MDHDQHHHHNKHDEDRVAYIVSDLAPGYDKLKTPYWRTTGVFSCILAAKKWASPSHSIITIHKWHEATAIHAKRKLPDEYRIVG